MKLFTFFRALSLASLVGITSGVSASIFLVLLNKATLFRESHPFLIWGLPLAGLFIGWIFNRFGKGAEKGSNLVIEQIEGTFSSTPATLPGRMAPLVLGGTLVTHFFGGSAGREGTAVQMGASLADQWAAFFHVTPGERKKLLIAGAGSGFGAAIGAPWAGVIFGLEMLRIGPLRFEGLTASFIASWVAFGVTHFLKVPHSIYPSPEVPPLATQGILVSALVGVFFGFVALSFSRATHLFEHFWEKLGVSVRLRPFWAGFLLILLFYLEGSERYAGLGISVIQESLILPGHWEDGLWKFLFTVVTIGSGFKGGEFIPLVFIGTCLGSSFSHLPFFSYLSFDILGALGFAAVFGAASNTPLACFVMALELFGVSLWPYALVACFFAYWASGHRGIYQSQSVSRHKLFFLKKPF